MLKSYIAFDIETTGLSPEENEIIEIGALKVRDGKVQERFMEFIKPRLPIPANITGITGITNDMVEDARGREQVIPDFLQFCGQDGIDTLKIARTVHRDLPSKSLGELCEHYRINNAAAHRAYHDALATAKLYQTMAHYFEEKEPQVFQPCPLVCTAKKCPPATKKQLDFLMRLVKQKGVKPAFDPETLTRNEASRLIDSILSGQAI